MTGKEIKENIISTVIVLIYCHILTGLFHYHQYEATIFFATFILFLGHFIIKNIIILSRGNKDDE
jgi:hypothetical protein